MSDSIKELCKEYEENVAVPRARSVGLFTIPEYPEYDVRRGMWSSALDAILTTLRYLAPATLLTLLWGQQSLILKLLKYIDSAFRSLLFTNDEQKQAVLQWLSDYGSVRVEDLGTVWRQGWILCGVLDAALPGACAGHPPTSLSLQHAQAIAEHYLEVEPVFTRQELESNGTLSKHQEWRLTTYLEKLRQAVSKVTKPVTKLSPQKSTTETTQFIFDYIARGSGLTAAQINKTTYFKIYPTSQQSLDPSEIKIVIKGPDNIYGMKVVPPVLGKAQLIRQQLLGVKFQSSYTENRLPLAHGTSYLRNFGKNDMNKTYHIPKPKYNIEIEVESTPDHAKISYMVKSEGKYEICITSKGQHIVGSPYIVTSSQNIIDYLEKDSFSLENGEEIDIVDIKTDRKVLVRIVDFVTEKMLLKENGDLEKISEDEAKYLMENNTKAKESIKVINPIICNINSMKTENSDKKSNKFNNVANKVIKINKVCKLFQDIINEKIIVHGENNELLSRSQQDIPDVVNSTLIETTVNPFMLSNNRDKFIVPENISVSILTEKIEANECNDSTQDIDDISNDDNITLADLKILRDLSFDDETVTKSANNPFLHDANIQDNKIEKILGTFVPSEYETNKIENEETQNTATKIVIDVSNESLSLDKRNPFLDLDIIKADRPKSPIFKILPDEAKNQIESIYYDNVTVSKNTASNECINPFFIQHQTNSNDQQNLPITDFIIGAPVSLPPDISGDLNRSLSQETNSEGIDTSIEKNVEQSLDIIKKPSEMQSKFSAIKPDDNMYSNIYSNLEDNINECKKDMWDSAYVSIDENNILLDNNNNDSNVFKDVENNQNSNYFSKMGPAEREIWENCLELKDDVLSKLHDEVVTINKRDLKKSNFTPIMEENDINLLSGMKVYSESEKNTETDPVNMALAEIDDLCNDYCSSSENNFTDNDNIENHDKEVELLNEYDYVKSASENETDVIRHKIQSEGMISEVQTHVTESVSVSQTLHVHKSEEIELENTDQMKFGDYKQTNIVLEKKKYWDEKIRQIEQNAEELRAQQRKRRLSVKQIRRNDSLSKRKGKQIVKKYLNSNEGNKKQIKTTENEQGNGSNCEYPSPQNINKEDTLDIKRVKNWKLFWDNKLETDNLVKNSIPKTNYFKTQSYSDLWIGEKDNLKIDTRTHSNNNSTESSLPVKQEITEEVFKAFETSPKRFFGTSRKQILSKIDTFLGKPNTIDEPLADSNETTCESGLVSSRISLFHNMSQTEVSSWSQRKSQSMHNIYHHKDNANETTSTPDIDIVTLNLDNDDIFTSSPTNQDGDFKRESGTIKNVTLKEKRARMTDTFYTKSVDETSYHRSEEDLCSSDVEGSSYVKKTINLINRPHTYQASKNCDNIHKISSSKSEMDIFNKFTNKAVDEDFHKYKSCDELPKVSVKSFISLYEDVSKNSKADSTKKSLIRSPERSKKQLKSACSIYGTADNMISIDNGKTVEDTITTHRTDCNGKVSSNIEICQQSSKQYQKIIDEVVKEQLCSEESKELCSRDFDKESTYVSLSDIDLEIVDKSSDGSKETSPEREIEYSSDYKSRFKLAKQYFQSLEELREVKKPKKLNECELLLYNKSKESLVENSQTKREKKKIKSHTMPSSEISQFWSKMQEQENGTKESKLIKISEKFHVEDLFSDVMEGRLSRQGSMRGIPHKKAVLEAFRSMENISNNNLSPYELAVTQLSDFGDGNRVKSAQTYLNEYPYLPTTDPSKFQSRLDVNASGLISFKELINKRVRRNSVPDLRLNPSFTVTL